MNEKLDLTTILKDCPKGTEFYSRCIGVVKFESIDNTLKRIIVKNEREIVSYKENGVYYYADEDAEIDLFPSKEQKDWNKWQRPFKDGDIVFCYDTIAIFKEWGDETLFRTYVIKYLCSDSLIDINTPLFGKGIRKEIRFATEEEKLKLFQAIKDNGYKWNSETNTLEKLIVPKFKVGDSIQSKTNNNNKFTITNIDNDGFYYGCGKNGRGKMCEYMIPIKKQDDWILIPNKFDPKPLKHFDNMTRDEEIKEAAEKRTLEIFGELDDFQDRTDGFIEGAKWADKTIIDKVCQWLMENIDEDVLVKCGSVIKCIDAVEFSEYFRKAMEE